MAFLSSQDDSLAAFVEQEPFRFTRALPLIATRFTPPRSPETLLARERLLQRLDDATSRRLTLVCAPAGFGKTTLLAQWYRHRHRQGDALAWLSLDEDDSAPLLFMRYLQEALRPLWQGWSSSFLHALEGELPADITLFLAELVNQLNQCPHPLYLILDDYQCITDPAIQRGMSWLLNHAPSSLHLIIGSRNQPPLALSRLQMQDQLLEVYDQELRFNPGEASAYFSGASGLNPQAIPRLIALTDGWVAGMKMAALSAEIPTATGLSASSRSISRYLEEVIFAPLPPEVFDFLLHTSMLNRLHPALCDAVSGKSNASEMLGWIERHNLFLSVLDESGVWFRYHPLMRDALLHRLQHSSEIDIRQLHDRASGWFASQQLWAEAIRHALAAGKSATKDAEAGAQSLAEEGDIDTLVRWIRYLPDNLDPSRIELQLNLAWALAHRFRFSDARQLLDAIEVQAAVRPDVLVHSSRVKLQVVRAICEAFADNISRSIAIVEPLLHEVPCGDVWVDGLVCNILSYCHLADSRPQQALDVQQRVAGMSVANRNLFVEVYRAFVMAQGYLRQGNLAEAERQASRALRYAQQHTGVNSSSGATLAPILAEIAWEKGDVEQVQSLLAPRLEMIDNFCPPDGLSRCYIVLARQAREAGEREKAESLLLHAEGLAAQRGWLRAQAPLLVERLAMSLIAGDRSTAEALLCRLQGLNQTQQQDAVGGYIALSQGRLLYASGEPLAAARLLDKLASIREHNGEWLFAVRLRLMQAVALWRGGSREQAMDICRPALSRALHQGLWRSLVEGREEMVSLLCEMLKRSPADDALAADISTLLSRFSAAGVVIDSRHPQPPGLRLTEREQQTLRLIADGYSNKGVARELGISAETVKWHLKQLYEKLQVKGRIQAVNQAREWHLLS
ncbi:LuxR C-terminal-related transcriptional regulator [Klebsiella spallanzanii]|uniref:LuxR C-terminal-related transcriptional regulator n=1 Tax=Klebsiella spallanzanii TaxID=2587528 RepID=UPI0011584F80|nr:LuxR C-terminal-related transcriptional regulator [Klebsiella spallanzanii]VUS86770.1 HTH-type transcriptional regulator MalT [Klebsiella spallanzanii]